LCAPPATDQLHASREDYLRAPAAGSARRRVAASAPAPWPRACRPSAPLVREPAPFVTRCRRRTVANGDSTTFELGMLPSLWNQSRCSRVLGQTLGIWAALHDLGDVLDRPPVSINTGSNPQTGFEPVFESRPRFR